MENGGSFRRRRRDLESRDVSGIGGPFFIGASSSTCEEDGTDDWNVAADDDGDLIKRFHANQFGTLSSHDAIPVGHRTMPVAVFSGDGGRDSTAGRSEAKASGRRHGEDNGGRRALAYASDGGSKPAPLGAAAVDDGRPSWQTASALAWLFAVSPAFRRLTASDDSGPFGDCLRGPLVWRPVHGDDEDDDGGLLWFVGDVRLRASSSTAAGRQIVAYFSIRCGAAFMVTTTAVWLFADFVIAVGRTVCALIWLTMENGRLLKATSVATLEPGM
nr:hypothetical protein Iba_chr01dCG5040 [Ipomoea batatas]